MVRLWGTIPSSSSRPASVARTPEPGSRSSHVVVVGSKPSASAGAPTTASVFARVARTATWWATRLCMPGLAEKNVRSGEG
jgi:hypothetical protein